MKILLGLIFGFLLSLPAWAQTEKINVEQSITPASYSESKQYQQREFPTNKNSKAKKELNGKINVLTFNSIIIFFYVQL